MDAVKEGVGMSVCDSREVLQEEAARMSDERVMADRESRIERSI